LAEDTPRASHASRLRQPWSRSVHLHTARWLLSARQGLVHGMRVKAFAWTPASPWRRTARAARPVPPLRVARGRALARHRPGRSAHCPEPAQRTELGIVAEAVTGAVSGAVPGAVLGAEPRVPPPSIAHFLRHTARDRATNQRERARAADQSDKLLRIKLGGDNTKLRNNC
jgi:hypothetical protein